MRFVARNNTDLNEIAHSTLHIEVMHTNLLNIRYRSTPKFRSANSKEQHDASRYTHLMPSIVREVSAMLVASTTLRAPGGVGSKILACEQSSRNNTWITVKTDCMHSDALLNTAVE
eukprot:1161646-Pelagomonas_calceolata.AAC.7